MKKWLSVFTLIAFLSISFVSAGHLHDDTESGHDTDCPLCVFLQTTPTVPSADIVPIISVIFKELTPLHAAFIVASPLFVLPGQRAPPSV
jgi:hypothetical protein